MSTWQIFADTGNSFRWEISGQLLQTEPGEELHGASIQQSSSAHRLPSMADLLLQGCSKLMENGPDHVDSPPMFKTGLGKSVVLKKSSISKALSILGDEGDLVPASGGKLCGRGNQGSISNSMFQTGSGKAVNISSTGLVRAKTLLGLEENHENDTFHAFERTKKQSNASEPFHIRSSSLLSVPEVVTNTGLKDTISAPISPFNFQSGSLGSELKEVTPNYVHSAPRPPPIKFHTAGGRSISVSSDALQRARSLLGDPEVGTFLNDRDSSDSAFSICKDTKSTDSSSNKENVPNTSLPYQETTNIKQTSKVFISPIRSSSNHKQSSVRSNTIHSGSNLIKKLDAESDDRTNRRYDDIPRPLKPLTHRPHSLNGVSGDSAANCIGSKVNVLGRSSALPLLDISNTVGIDDTDKKQTLSEKRRFGRRSSISPFKRPRISKFITPLNSNTSMVANGLSSLAPEESYSKQRVSTRYPFQASRPYIKKYFGVPPFHHNMLEHLPDCVRRMNPESAEKHIFHEGSGLDSVGADAFSHMLSEAGASMQFVSPKWVANHFKWIVWKLACYERCYPAKFSGKLLTASNAIEELKYRYEQEVNHGHRSAIRRILEGDASPSSMLVLCISSIYSESDRETETLATSDGADGTKAAKIEVTDGWYSVNALLDVLLSKKLAAGKLFVGQKLRIAGAGLCGWVGPVSPLEASNTVSLSLHINGTYRAHWGDRLGLCKESGIPLAFRCIKGFGGAVPSTLVGVTRIYPVLYRERLRDGGFVVRSERLETKMIQLYNQRRSTVAEGIMSEFQMGNKESDIQNDYDSDEGAKILKILETAAEPEVLMAEMSSEQLNSFATYRAKLEAMRQSDVHKSIEKALVDAGLSEREVTPFMRVRVVGLTTKSDAKKSSRKGLITIWNPAVKQQSELVEGKAYVISALVPLSSDSDTLYLQASGGTTKWMPLSSSAIEQFQPFFSPRKPVPLSKMGEVPLSSEFDIAAFVVYVGEVYTVSHQKKQWVFVTDGSISALNSEEPSNALLAISFSSPYIDGDSFVPINYNLEGSTVGFCNLIKKAKDQMNHLWVAEATENSAYFLSYDHAHCTHLTDAAASAQRWAKNSSKTIEKLRVKVLSIIGKC